jgi:hypothetical protein
MAAVSLLKRNHKGNDMINSSKATAMAVPLMTHGFSRFNIMIKATPTMGSRINIDNIGKVIDLTPYPTY